MNIFIYSDIHVSTNSSVLRSRGPEYSTRLEFIVKTINWAEEKIGELSSMGDIVVNLGDTFDKAVVTDEEVTAISKIKWGKYNALPHYVLVGNHESSVRNLEYSTVNMLQLNDLFQDHIITEPTTLNFDGSWGTADCKDVQINLLPYISVVDEKERGSLSDYFTFEKGKKQIILSHNDIAGVQMGAFNSQVGFDVNDILEHSDLYLNGHLHNSMFITPGRILNVGNLCGMNFSEDATKYKHGLWKLNTDTMELKFYENPYALNFYPNITINNETPSLDNYSLEENCVLKIKCERSHLNDLRKELESEKYVNKVIAHALEVYDDEIIMGEVESKESIIESIDSVQAFKDFIIDKLGSTSLVMEELGEICK